MLFLFLSILSSSSIALIFKYSESRDMNRYAVTTINYLAAVVVSGTIIFSTGYHAVGPASIFEAATTIWRAITVTGEKVGPEISPVWAVTAGSLAGAFFFLAFISYQISVRRAGVGLAGAFAKVGTLVPLSLSLVFWREYPGICQWLGIAVAVVSILLINWPRKGDVAGRIRSSLLVLFLFAGMAEFSNKVFQQYGLQSDRALFLCTTFSVAFVLSLIITLRKRLPIRKRDLLVGAAVGVPNLFSSYFLIMALETVPATVAFAAFGAGTILLINLGGRVVFGERLTAREKAVVILTAISLILMNL